LLLSPSLCDFVWFYPHWCILMHIFRRRNIASVGSNMGDTDWYSMSYVDLGAIIHLFHGFKWMVVPNSLYCTIISIMWLLVASLYFLIEHLDLCYVELPEGCFFSNIATEPPKNAKQMPKRRSEKVFPGCDRGVTFPVTFPDCPCKSSLPRCQRSSLSFFGSVSLWKFHIAMENHMFTEFTGWWLT
jgi:hypothetical protein